MNKSQIIPIGDRVVLALSDQPTEQKTTSGLYLPETASEKKYEGTVIAVGPGTPQWPTMQTSVDDYVQFIPGAGTPITKEGKEYLILQEREILAVI